MINWIEVMQDLQADKFWVSELLVTPATVELVVNCGNVFVEVFVSTETNKIVGSELSGVVTENGGAVCAEYSKEGIKIYRQVLKVLREHL